MVKKGKVKAMWGCSEYLEDIPSDKNFIAKEEEILSPLKELYKLLNAVNRKSNKVKKALIETQKVWEEKEHLRFENVRLKEEIRLSIQMQNNSSFTTMDKESNPTIETIMHEILKKAIEINDLPENSYLYLGQVAMDNRFEVVEYTLRDFTYEFSAKFIDTLRKQLSK